ncbi:hypothetical protein BO223_07780 [Faecalibaculum rodentium]|uniref:Uncharacterized protein n=1 Tax=Faecalibaculum rodentium TaxID=1702221 RepID=A0A1Q9YJE5_9FIRM|nr:hypothetical protein BO223_07780 [Faecalibaculum rodentium]
MNDSIEKGKTLVLVEGIGEKEQFFRTLCSAFPELNIRQEDIYVYETNIYRLLHALKAEYGDDLSEMDVDLPVILSKDHPDLIGFRKDSFVNIILIFDFELQDPDFSQENIRLLQVVFSDVTDNGQLYLNYPMYESCYDCNGLNDPDFRESVVRVPAAGKTETWSGEYKSRVKEKKNTIRNTLFLTVDQVDKILQKANVHEASCRKELCALKKSPRGEVHLLIAEILNRYMDDLPESLPWQLASMLFQKCDIQPDESYNEFHRRGLKTLAGMHLQKACWLQKDSFFNPMQLLEVQLTAKDTEQKLYIINTGILFLADYNPNLLA